MIKLTPLLYESTVKMYKTISISDAEKLIKQNASKSYNNIVTKGNELYRGINSTAEYLYADSSLSTRKSITNDGKVKGNFYNIIIDYVFPKHGFANRNNAIICSSWYGNSGQYGRVYIVIPFDNVKLTIAPRPDIWKSITKLDKYIETLPELNDYFYELWEAFRDKLIDKVSSRNISDWTINDIKILLNYRDKYLKSNLTDLATDKKLRQLSFDKLIELFNPIQNKFKTVDVIKYKNVEDMDREIWFNGKAVLIDLNILGQIKI